MGSLRARFMKVHIIVVATFEILVSHRSKSSKCPPKTISLWKGSRKSLYRTYIHVPQQRPPMCLLCASLVGAHPVPRTLVTRKHSTHLLVYCALNQLALSSTARTDLSGVIEVHLLLFSPLRSTINIHGDRRFSQPENSEPLTCCCFTTSTLQPPAFSQSCRRRRLCSTWLIGLVIDLQHERQGRRANSENKNDVTGDLKSDCKWSVYGMCSKSRRKQDGISIFSELLCRYMSRCTYGVCVLPDCERYCLSDQKSVVYIFPLPMVAVVSSHIYS